MKLFLGGVMPDENMEQGQEILLTDKEEYMDKGEMNIDARSQGGRCNHDGGHSCGSHHNHGHFGSNHGVAKEWEIFLTEGRINKEVNDNAKFITAFTNSGFQALTNKLDLAAITAKMDADAIKEKLCKIEDKISCDGEKTRIAVSDLFKHSDAKTIDELRARLDRVEDRGRREGERDQVVRQIGVDVNTGTQIGLFNKEQIGKISK